MYSINILGFFNLHRIIQLQPLKLMNNKIFSADAKLIIYITLTYSRN
jgi:hypothetical protein